MPRLIGSEKQKFGAAVYTVFIDPGAVAAAANIALPAWAAGADDLLQLLLGISSSGNIADPIVAKTIVAKGTAAPGAGEACLYDEDNLRLGDATTAFDWIMATFVYKSFKVTV